MVTRLFGKYHKINEEKRLKPTIAKRNIVIIEDNFPRSGWRLAKTKQLIYNIDEQVRGAKFIVPI